MKLFSQNSLKAFSIIEVMVGIFVFSLGLISIYALLASSLSVNSYNKHAIIAGNLAREQVELIKNLRDSNYENLRKWNMLDSAQNLEAGKYYTFGLESSGDIEFDEISPFAQGENELDAMQSYRVCLDGTKYVYCSSGGEETVFYKYIFVEQTQDESGNNIADALTITSKAIWYHRGYHEYEIKTLITDWRRI